MYTCYECGKSINGEVKHTGVINIARKTGWNPITKKSMNLDFPKAWHPLCYVKANKAEA